MIKRLLIVASSFSLIVASAASAHPQSGWNGGYYHGPRPIYVAPILGNVIRDAVFDAATGTHVVCQSYAVGWQIVQQCVRVANQPPPPAYSQPPDSPWQPLRSSDADSSDNQSGQNDSTVSEACQAAVNANNDDQVRKYCN